MTPHKKDKQVQIDPTVKNKDLTYGPVSFDVYDEIGKIVRNHFSNKFKEMSYLVQYDDGTEHWFLEHELI